MKGMFFDTSAIYAYINGKDPDHKKVKSSIERFSGKLLITNYIFDEVITLILSRLGHKTALKVGNILLNSSQVEKIWVTQSDEKEAWNLLSERKDKGYSFTDCISFVVMRRANIRAYIATDRHFKQEGFERA
tara:strand:- start:1381 stop:1776 length:396 start_codon:yes stop_codon:yes gene_type:complete